MPKPRVARHEPPWVRCPPHLHQPQRGCVPRRRHRSFAPCSNPYLTARKFLFRPPLSGCLSGGVGGAIPKRRRSKNPLNGSSQPHPGPNQPASGGGQHQSHPQFAEERDGRQNPPRIPRPSIKWQECLAPNPWRKHPCLQAHSDLAPSPKGAKIRSHDRHRPTPRGRHQSLSRAPRRTSGVLLGSLEDTHHWVDDDEALRRRDGNFKVSYNLSEPGAIQSKGFPSRADTSRCCCRRFFSRQTPKPSRSVG